MHKTTKALIKEGLNKDNNYYKGRTKKLVKAYMKHLRKYGKLKD